MNKIIAKVKATYEQSPVKKITVPEWEIDLFYRRVKGDELDLMATLTPDVCTPTRSNTEVIIVKALDANGVRLFGNDDGEDLYTWAEMDVINRVAKLMMATAMVEDQKDFFGDTQKS